MFFVVSSEHGEVIFLKHEYNQVIYHGVKLMVTIKTHFRFED